MGQGLSCTASRERGLFAAVQSGDLQTVETLVERDRTLLCQTTVYDRQSALHIAAASGQIEILSMLLDRSANPDLLNRHKQTPLMLAAMNGNISCVEKLIQAGANILMFDSIYGRTCLHYAAYYGHVECLKSILSAARSSHVAVSWGFARFVNIGDGKGATPLHLAARQSRPECVHVLLESGALVCASTSRYGFPGSSPLHLAARGGSIDCIRELLAWGADRLQRNASGKIPYLVALKHKHGVCAALLNPSAPEPLVWPSPLKFISDLDGEAKALLEQALMDANRDREKNILKGTAYSLPSPSPSHSDAGMDDDVSEASDSDLCCICFDQACTIEVQDCGHQMCAHCALALCCYNKPNQATASSLTMPVCPFCRCTIARLVVAQVTTAQDMVLTKLRRLRKGRNSGEGSSSSFRGLTAVGSLGKIGGRSSGRIVAETEWANKP
ncbi:hypothetical protein NMG60_11014611 [Bertholletia excelsa]